MKITTETIMQKLKRSFLIKTPKGSFTIVMYEEHDDVFEENDAGWNFKCGSDVEIFDKFTKDEKEEVEDFISNLDIKTGDEIVHTTKIAIKE